MMRLMKLLRVGYAGFAVAYSRSVGPLNLRMSIRKEGEHMSVSILVQRRFTVCWEKVKKRESMTGLRKTKLELMIRSHRT